MFISLPQQCGRRVAIDLRRITKIVDFGDGTANIYFDDGDIVSINGLADWHGLIGKINEDLYGIKR